jgi:hypothetical protein
LSVDIKEIRELAERYTPEQIEGCITEQIETGRNVCLRDANSERIVGELAKASFVKKLMEEKGISLADALRELARRIRELAEIGRKSGTPPERH